MDWQLPSTATELLWTHAECEITSKILSFERIRHFVSYNKDENFIHRVYRPIKIRYIFFSCNLHFTLNVCCNHSIIPFIIVINKIILNRKAPAVKNDHAANSGSFRPLPVNDNISKMRAKRCKIQIVLKLSPCWFNETNYYIKGVCLVMSTLLTPLARVRLSKQYTTKTTTMYRSLRIEGNGI